MLNAHHAEETFGELQVTPEMKEETLMQLRAEEKACNVIGVAVMGIWQKIAGRRCQTRVMGKEAEKEKGRPEKEKATKGKEANQGRFVTTVGNQAIYLEIVGRPKLKAQAKELTK